ncbi:Fungal hydrophobin, partial [Haplosporangium sp. Z 27]
MASLVSCSGGNGGNGGNGGPVCAQGLLYTQAQCCRTGILNVADLDCKAASRSYNGINDFKAACATEGRSARCCSIPVASLGVLCNDV